MQNERRRTFSIFFQAKDSDWYFFYRLLSSRAVGRGEKMTDRFCRMGKLKTTKSTHTCTLHTLVYRAHSAHIIHNSTAIDAKQIQGVLWCAREIPIYICIVFFIAVGVAVKLGVVLRLENPIEKSIRLIKWLRALRTSFIGQITWHDKNKMANDTNASTVAKPFEVSMTGIFLKNKG